MKNLGSLFLNLWVAALIAVGFCRYSLAEPSTVSPNVQLQWIDSSSNVVLLDWPATVRWVWRQKSVQAQVRIVLPPLLQLKVSDDSIFQVLEDDDHSELIVETQSPNLTEKLQILEDTAEENSIGVQETGHSVGLVMALNFNSVHSLVHESCAQEGVSLKEVKLGSSFLVLGVYCSKNKNGEVTAHVSLSDDAEFSLEQGLSKKSSLEIQLDSKKNLTKRIQIQSKSGSEFSEYELVLKKIIKNEKPKRVLKKSPQKANWQFAWSLSPTYLVYSNAIAGSQFDPSYYSLKLGLLTEYYSSDRRLHLEGEVNLPGVTVLPKLQFPANGAYELDMRGIIPIFKKDDKFILSILPGFSAVGFHLDQRPDAPKILWGPQAMIEASGPLYRVRVGYTPFFNSYKISTFFSYELSRSVRASYWDLTLHADYFKLYPSGNQPIDMTEVSFGFLIGY